MSSCKRTKCKNASIKHKRMIYALICAVAALMIAFCAITAKNILDRRPYRLLYPDEILACAEEFSLDPCLVAAVIQTESSNRAQVISPKGAVGLMQIMPATGEWIAAKLNVSDYSEEKLKEPLFNIRLGCWYIRYLLDKYGGNERTALYAYNAGPGNVDKWLKDPQYAGINGLENVPYTETADYAVKVQSAKEKYSKLYEKEFCS